MSVILKDKIGKIKLYCKGAVIIYATFFLNYFYF